jgi:hypothetical protein
VRKRSEIDSDLVGVNCGRFASLNEGGGFEGKWKIWSGGILMVRKF